MFKKIIVQLIANWFIVIDEIASFVCPDTNLLTKIQKERYLCALKEIK